MKNIILIIATFALFAGCSDKRKQSITPKDIKSTDQELRQPDSHNEITRDTSNLKMFEGPAMTPLGDVPAKKNRTAKRMSKHSTGS